MKAPYWVIAHRDDGWMIRLKAGNHKEIVWGEHYLEERTARHAIRLAAESFGADPSRAEVREVDERG